MNTCAPEHLCVPVILQAEVKGNFDLWTASEV